MIAAYISRSKESKLMVKIFPPGLFSQPRAVDQLFEELKGGWHRTRSLDIPADRLSRRVNDLIAQMGVLRELCLGADYMSLATPEKLPISSSSLLSLQTECPVHWPACSLPQLQSLTVVLPEHSWSVLAFTVLLNSLRLFPTLQTLIMRVPVDFPGRGVQTWEKDFSDHRSDEPAPTLPNLHRLTIDGFGPSLVKVIMESLKAPQLHDLSIWRGSKAPSANEHSWSAIAPHYPELQRLSLRGWAYTATLFHRVMTSSSEPLIYDLELSLHSSAREPVLALRKILVKHRLPSLRILRTSNIPLQTIRHILEGKTNFEWLQISAEDATLGPLASRERISRIWKLVWIGSVPRVE